MNIQDFCTFIDEQDELFLSLRKDQTDRERILSNTLKVSEEFGELCDEILGSFGEQRKDKLEERDPENLKNEFADVIITIFLLAKSLDIDIMESLDARVEKIKTSHNKKLFK